VMFKIGDRIGCMCNGGCNVQFTIAAIDGTRYKSAGAMWICMMDANLIKAVSVDTEEQLSALLDTLQ